MLKIAVVAKLANQWLASVVEIGAKLGHRLWLDEDLSRRCSGATVFGLRGECHGSCHQFAGIVFPGV